MTSSQPPAKTCQSTGKLRVCLLVGSSLLLLAGVAITHLTCSDFSSRWNSAAQNPSGDTPTTLKAVASAPVTQPTTRVVAASQPETDLLAGRWEGKWISTGHGLSGKLQAILVKRPDGQYDAFFHAQVAGPLTSDHEVIFTVVKKPGRYEFSGKKDLGWLKGGVYTFTGTADGQTLLSNYDCGSDQGQYELKRVPSSRPATAESP